MTLKIFCYEQMLLYLPLQKYIKSKYNCGSFLFHQSNMRPKKEKARDEMKNCLELQLKASNKRWENKKEEKKTTSNNLPMKELY